MLKIDDIDVVSNCQREYLHKISIHLLVPGDI